VNRNDHPEVSCFLCEQTFVVHHVPDRSLSPSASRWTLVGVELVGGVDVRGA
jgi:hypothetical protein